MPAMLNGESMHVQRNPETRERRLRQGDLVAWQEVRYVVTACMLLEEDSSMKQMQLHLRF